MSLESINISPENIHTKLKQELLSNTISAEEFRNKLIEMDQSTDDRLSALENLKLLNDPEIVSYVENQSEEIKKGYYQILGFTELHVGQIKALQENNSEEALKYFEKSLEHEYQANTFPENVAYKKCIIAYFKSDIGLLEKEITDNIQGNNLKIVQNMLKGLKERNFPNYREDYKV